jgi:4-amino-4-deoxy-L-arabinose transferase-like glycosyltransferase
VQEIQMTLVSLFRKLDEMARKKKQPGTQVATPARIGKISALHVTMLLAIFATALRFVALEKSPPGFYVDEAAVSAQVICIQQSGTDNFKRSFPIFAPVLGGGYATPAMLYAGAAWTTVFGYSIASLRSFAALHGALTVVGVFFLALALWRRRDTAWFAALACALSPWGFIFSRIAWDPPLAPCYFIWGLVFILTDGRFEKSRALIGGLLLSLACYSYPPLRLQSALVLPPVFIVCFHAFPKRRASYVFAALAFAISLIPLAELTLSGEVQGRFNVLSITSDSYLKQFGGFSVPLVLKIFAHNMALNLSPSFLFWSGDGNLRHSTQVVGEWSWLEILALLSALVLFVRKKLTVRKSEVVIFSLLVWSYVAGVIPAAMTWESNPHALRSIGAYPFLALAAGFALERSIEVWRGARFLILAVALAFAGYYFTDFFADFPYRSELWFDTAVVRASRVSELARVSGRVPNPSEEILKVSPEYPELARRYYELSSGFASCVRK